ncbi:MAG: hypothetical protein ACRCUA_04460, partial [Fusobacteriaceae bacterium]
LNYNKNISNDEIIEKFKKYCENNPIPTKTEIYKISSLPSPDLIGKRFGGYGEFLKLIGFKPHLNIRKDFNELSDENILKMLKDAIERGEIKNKEELNNSETLPNTEYYRRRFKIGWRELLKLVDKNDIILRKSYTKDELLNIYGNLLKKYNTNKISAELFEKETGISKNDIIKKFGSWKIFLSQHGIEYQFSKANETDKELIENYKILSEKLEKNIHGASSVDIQKNLKHNFSIYLFRFGSMNKLRKLSGYIPAGRDKGYTEAELIKLITEAVEKKGDYLTFSDIKRDKNLPGYKSFRGKLGVKSLKELYQKLGIKIKNKEE